MAHTVIVLQCNLTYHNLDTLIVGNLNATVSRSRANDDIRAGNSLWMAEQKLGLHEISWFGTEGCGDHLQEAYLTSRETSGGDLHPLSIIMR
jgi:hypothetical protein